MNRSIKLLSSVTKASKPVQMNVARFSGRKIVAQSIMRTQFTSKIQTPFGFVRHFNDEEPRKRTFKQDPPLTTNVLLVRAPVGVDIQSALANFGVVENGVHTFETGATPFTFVEFNSAEDATRALRFIRSRSKNPSSEVANTSVAASSAEEIEALRTQSSTPSTVVVLPKIPFAFTESQLAEVFPGYQFADVSVGHGKAYIKLSPAQEADKFLADAASATIGKYSVNAFKSIQFDMDKHKKTPVNTVKVKGQPAETTEDEIREFFEGLSVGKISMHSLEIPNGRTVTEVFVTFNDPADVNAALEKDRQKIGSRWVSIKRSSAKEVRKLIQRKRDQENSRNVDQLD
uniref:Predicted protein n=1 Tax=Hordeum vulgare subsp. vulgare TaxID=112509 RepID=F2DWW4_HORVV|nr:predicted protein [Hordeum vulgare subsp. vulgare]